MTWSFSWERSWDEKRERERENLWRTSSLFNIEVELLFFLHTSEWWFLKERNSSSKKNFSEGHPDSKKELIQYVYAAAAAYTYFSFRFVNRRELQREKKMFDLIEKKEWDRQINCSRNSTFAVNCLSSASPCQSHRSVLRLLLLI